MSKKGLGKGLSALIPEPAAARGEAVVSLELDRIQPNPQQPRRDFDDESLADLAKSIQEHGIVQPVLVRLAGDDYELVAGERRWRAARLAGLKTIPAVVRNLEPRQVREIALVENLQREDLNPIEEAEAYQALVADFGLTQDELGQRVGKSRPHIANTMRLLQLPPAVRKLLASGELSFGHGKVLLGLGEPTLREGLAMKAAQEGWSVRETEQAVALGKQKEQRGVQRRSDRADERRDPEIVQWEGRLRDRLGSPVRIVPGEVKGRIEITFYGPDDLTRLLEQLEHGSRSWGGGVGERKLTV